MGLALVAVGTEQTIESATHDVLPIGARWTLCGGVALYTAAILMILLFTCRRNFSWTTVWAIAIALGLAIWGGSLPPLVLEGGLLAMLLWKVGLNIRSTDAPLSIIEDEPS